MKNYLICSPDGDIVVHGVCQDSDMGLQPMKPGEFMIEAMANPETQYVDPVSKQVAERQPMNLQVSGTTISGLPVDSTVVLNEDDVFEVLDGEIEFNTSIPGIYEVVCSAPGYLTKKVVLEVL